MLSHDIINRVSAIVSNCDQLETEIPSPWCFDRTAKIKQLALGISEILLVRECEIASLTDVGGASLPR